MPHDWKQKLQALPETRNGQTVLVKHNLPDIFLVSAAAGQKITVVIADPTVCWADIKGAAARKMRAYEPLRKLIEEHLGSKCDQVRVVPIAFSARGTPPAEWGEICNLMKFKVPSVVLLKKIQVKILEALEGIMKMWQWQRENAVGRVC